MLPVYSSVIAFIFSRSLVSLLGVIRYGNGNEWGVYRNESAVLAPHLLGVSARVVGALEVNWYGTAIMVRLKRSHLSSAWRPMISFFLDLGPMV